MSVKQLIYVTSKSGQYIYVNDNFCQLLGYSEQELLTLDSRQVTHPDMPEVAIKELSATLNKGFSWQGVLRVTGKNGDDIWLDVFITPQYNHGEVIGYQNICRVAEPKLSANAKRIYDGINQNNKLSTFELSKNHKFAALVLLTVISQAFIFLHLGLTTSMLVAFGALAPIVILA